MPTMTVRRRRPAPASALDVAWDASRLRAAWDAASPNPTDVASAVGVTTETLRRWRRGLFVPDAVQLRDLARALQTTVDALLPPE